MLLARVMVVVSVMMLSRVMVLVCVRVLTSVMALSCVMVLTRLLVLTHVIVFACVMVFSCVLLLVRVIYRQPNSSSTCTREKWKTVDFLIFCILWSYHKNFQNGLHAKI